MATPLIGDPVLFPDQPHIIAATTEIYFIPTSPGGEGDSPSLKRLISGLGKKNFSVELVSPAQGLDSLQLEAAQCAAALKHLLGTDKASSVLTSVARPALSQNFNILFPLIYSSYTGWCTAGKGAEDPVVIAQRRLTRLKMTRLGLPLAVKEYAGSRLGSVLAHAAGLASVECAKQLRKGARIKVAQLMNSFTGIVFAKLGDREEPQNIIRSLAQIYVRGALGCSYIPGFGVVAEL